EMERRMAAPRPQALAARAAVAPNPGGPLEIAGIITGAAGFFAICAGVYYDLRSDGLAHPSMAPQASVLFLVGGAAVAGGGVLYWLGAREQRSHIGATPLPGGGGVVISGAFR